MPIRHLSVFFKASSLYVYDQKNKKSFMSVNLYLTFLLTCLVSSAAATEAAVTAKPGCKDKCGNITIPYPFGIGRRCSMDRWAEVNCDSSFDPPKLFFSHHIPYQIIEFSDVMSESSGPFVRVKDNVSSVCVSGSGALTSSTRSFYNTPFTLSPSNNQFIVIGCGVYGRIDGSSWSQVSANFTSGCMTLCDNAEIPEGGLCFGSGCCQIPLPLGTRQYSIHLDAFNITTTTSESTHCISAFLTEKEYKFKAIDIKSPQDTTLVLDYGIWNQTCQAAKEHPSSFACKGNSECVDLNSEAGFYCICPPGYQGYPYLDPGCQDVNECNDPQLHSCKYECINTPGGYRCGKEPFPFIWIILGVGVGLLLLAGSVWMYYRKRKQLLKLSEKLTQLNARLLLIQEISSHAKIFTAKKLEQATNNFHENRILGQGGYGTVYKGILPDQSIVAVKKSRVIEKSQFDQFINEVAILTKIDHRNIVKLLGCSVETEHPLLVYEFVSNGSLSDHIFKKGNMPYSSMSWENRLRIAAETAGALAYLHSSASLPIIHRDVKSSNILLDEHLTAKIADFGVSRVNHSDEKEISTLVKGTLGYLDPEYMLTSQLTEKSDVFSFGVVLAELLTGKKSISFERSLGERNLAIHFTTTMNEDRLFHIVEEGMVNQGNIKQVQGVAALAQRCLNCSGAERPSMKEVASQLEVVRGFSIGHSFSQKSNEEHAHFSSNNANFNLPSICDDGASGGVATGSMMSMTIPR